MIGHNRWLLHGLALALVAAHAQAEIKVQPDKDNVVSSRLAGKWEADENLTQRLEGKAAATLVFASDEAIAAKIPAKFEAFLKGKPVYLAGTASIGGVESPFILIDHKGNPHLVFFLQKDGEALGNPESVNVMLAVAKDTVNDLLFLGGDFNNQPFAAYRRVKAEPTP